MTARQGWDQAEFRCSRCPTRFTSTTEAQHTSRVQLHHAVHRIADTLVPLADLEPAEALTVAVDIARAMLDQAPGVVTLRLGIAVDCG